MIIENAGLSEQEVKFVLSDVDKTNKATLYEKTRNSMKKYLIGLNGEENDSSGSLHKMDSSIMYMNSKGRLIRPQANNWRPNVPQYRTSKPIRNAREGQPFNYGQNEGRGLKIPVHVPRNPMNEVKTMLCNICGAYTHLQSKCPHNPHNNNYVTENWDDFNGAIDYSVLLTL